MVLMLPRFAVSLLFLPPYLIKCMLVAEAFSLPLSTLVHK